MELERTTLGELCIGKGQYGIGASAVDFSEDKYTYLRITDIKDDGTLNIDDLKSVDDQDASKYILEPNDIVFARTGASTGRNYFYDGSDGELVYAGFLIKFSIDPQKVNPRFIKYYCLSSLYKGWVIGHTNGSTRGNINAQGFAELEIFLPPREQQDKMVAILDSIENKRRLNAQINKNLLEQAIALYKEIFIDAESEMAECRAEEYFDITIGKTPPRKESQWFSTDENDVRWVSISDMGKSGIYISESSEKLTEEAVNKFNVVRVPDNTVILSFKLTVGRIAITDGEMTTNEAIAHFKTNNKDINPYLYCYLTCFNFGNLGSTSSIATAVNSKIIKAMPFKIPNVNGLAKFNKVALPYFEMIKENQKAIKNLEQLRDNLIPKLMSGEIDVSTLEI